MNFRYKLMQFMRGRYGTDELFFVLFFLAALLYIANFFFHSWVIQLVIDVILVCAAFRVLSRNIEARRSENKYFRKFKINVYNKYNAHKKRKLDYNHIYKKCPSCHVVLRLPRRKGKHTTVCPKCNKSFKVYVFKA